MPVIKSAQKKLRQDKKRQFANKKTKTAYKSLVKQARENPSAKAVQATFSMLDKAAKNGIIHKNKASRLKSSLSKLLVSKKDAAPKEKETPTKQTPKTPKKKAPAKKQ
jgi:small subunit ribosomal protein S20